ncbi:hypothetical protein [Vibrio sp. WXL210]|uniref:hypothetical protein n=1 Tax=Vibrio sp. WXL210 TaxID=3450709 RepID=UPI003EC74995
MIKAKLKIALLVSTVIFAAGIATHSQANDKLSELDSEVFLSNVKPNSFAKAEMVDEALKVNFEKVTEAQKYSRWPAAKFTPQKGWWNWEDKKSIKFDVENPTNKSAKIYFKLIDSVGLSGQQTNQLNYGVQVNPGETKEVEMLLDGSKRKLAGYQGGTEINLKGIIELSVFARGPVSEQTVLLKNFQVVNNK